MAVQYTQGTVMPAGTTFNAENAAERLRKAMKGAGTKEHEIIAVLGSHCASERETIKSKYKTLYGRDLDSDLKSELSGNFETLCLYLMMPLRLFDAYCLHKAIKGLGTNEITLIEILAGRNNAEMKVIKESYKAEYKHTIEEDIKGDTSGDFRKVLLALSQGNRSEDQHVDPEQVTKDAQALLAAGKGKRFGTDEAEFIRILNIRSVGHLRAMFDAYKALDGKDIEASIKSETSGNFENALLAIVQYAKNSNDYYAKCFHESMKGLGTKDNRLMQLTVSHSEIDLADIKKAYHAKYGKTLGSMIKGDTGGDYGKLLLKIVGE